MERKQRPSYRDDFGLSLRFPSKMDVFSRSVQVLRLCSFGEDPRSLLKGGAGLVHSVCSAGQERRGVEM